MKQNGKQIIKLFGGLILTAIIFFSLSSTVFAVADYVQLAPIPGTACPPPAGSSAAEVATCKGVLNGGTNLSTYLTGMFKVAIATAGVLAFLMIVWGGFTYLSTDAITGKEEGKARIQRALGGLILALASYIILYTINPNLVSLNLNFGPNAQTTSYKWQKPGETGQQAFDRITTDINTNLDVTRATAQNLERQAKEAGDMLSAYYEGDVELTPEQVRELTRQATAKATEAQIVRLYNAGMDKINLAGAAVNLPEHLGDAQFINDQAASINAYIQEEIVRLSLLKTTESADAVNKLKGTANNKIIEICRKIPAPTTATTGGFGGGGGGAATNAPDNSVLVNACISNHKIK